MSCHILISRWCRHLLPAISEWLIVITHWWRHCLLIFIPLLPSLTVIISLTSRSDDMMTSLSSHVLPITLFSNSDNNTHITCWWRHSLLTLFLLLSSLTVNKTHITYWWRHSLLTFFLWLLSNNDNITPISQWRHPSHFTAMTSLSCSTMTSMLCVPGATSAGPVGAWWAPWCRRAGALLSATFQILSVCSATVPFTSRHSRYSHASPPWPLTWASPPPPPSFFGIMRSSSFPRQPPW